MGVVASVAWTLGLTLVAGALLARAEKAVERRGSRVGRPPVWRIGRQPAQPDPWLYRAGPHAVLVGVTLGALVIPFGRDLVGADLGIGLFYLIVVIDLVVLGIALGGWGANTPNSVEACYRAVAQLVAYVVPVGLAVLGPVMMAGSLSTVSIVEAQREAGLWYLLVQPLGFGLYVITALMQTYRPPFIEPFAPDIGHGVLGVFGGGRALAWRMALGGLLFVVAAMGATLFLGGYSGPWLPGPAWMVLKTGVVVALLWAVGAHVRPRSTAEMLELSWKYLTPLGLVNVLIVGGLILLGVGRPSS